MFPPKKILFATDFGPATDACVTFLLGLGQAFHVRAALLHVLKPWPPIPDLTSFVNDRLHQLSEQLMAKGIPVDKEWTSQGSVAGEIFDKAREWDADVILIGAGKILETGRFMPGTVSETVLEMAPQPVLAVHPTNAKDRVETILCPVDLSATSQRGLNAAIHLARGYRARLIVLSVIPETSWLSAVVSTGDLASPLARYRETWQNEFEKFIQSVDFSGVQWQREVREGAPYKEILAAARDHRADLISMASTGRTGLVRILMGSVARHIVQELPTSLLLVKEEELVRAAFASQI